MYIGTLIYTWLNGLKVGTDEFGNRYYRARKGKLYGRERRWVLFKDKVEASRVPAEWHAWLHHLTNEPLSEKAAEAKPWQKEHLANQTKCRTLVATHYHELTELAELLRGVQNYNVAVQEYEASGSEEAGIAFLHRIVPGGADKSYGVYVAKLAGIPPDVIQRSREILDELQRGFERESHGKQLTRRKTRESAQLPLFRDPSEEVLEELRGLNPETITPLDALQQIKKWRDRLGK